MDFHHSSGLTLAPADARKLAKIAALLAWTKAAR